jgi:hypothetical protein
VGGYGVLLACAGEGSEEARRGEVPVYMRQGSSVACGLCILFSCACDGIVFLKKISPVIQFLLLYISKHK